MAELLTLIGALATVLVGVAVLLQVISSEGIITFMGRTLLTLVLAMVILCILKVLWLAVMIPWLSAAFESFKTLIEWLLLIITSLIALSLVGRLAFWQLGRHPTLRRYPRTGDGYGNDNSKDTEN